MGQRGGYGFGSGSVSRVSSSGSSDDRTPPDLGHFRTLRLVGALFFGFDSSNDTYTTPDIHMCIERVRIQLFLELWSRALYVNLWDIIRDVPGLCNKISTNPYLTA